MRLCRGSGFHCPNFLISTCHSSLNLKPIDKSKSVLNNLLSSLLNSLQNDHQIFLPVIQIKRSIGVEIVSSIQYICLYQKKHKGW
ncbi:hypothetical protein B9Z55_016087 [Caenorhabditis nigoni]|uniref:Uncharacterized protein n=1 Tax=Caenorhabditis nigoni TaxID=1611254 RepID=A0A2G5UDC5_9PELO|nr:hypothetical protein B9Z55_016087 [Caenorhabditis nigoni]